MSSSLITRAICNDYLRRSVFQSTINFIRSRVPPRQLYSVEHHKIAKKMASGKLLPDIFKYVDKNAESFKTLLKEAVAIPSVSCDVKYREDCVRMVHWMQDKLKEVGATTQLRDVGVQTIEGKEVKLPPVLVGTLGNVSTFTLTFGTKQNHVVWYITEKDIRLECRL